MHNKLSHRVCKDSKCSKHCGNAHYLEDYSPPPCRWGNACRFINMSGNQVTNRDDARPCTFLHPCETHDEYYKRSKRCVPRLPPGLRGADKRTDITYYQKSTFRVPRCGDQRHIIHICVPPESHSEVVAMARKQGWMNIK